MIVTTWKKIEYEKIEYGCSEPYFRSWEAIEPDPEYWAEDGENPKWKLVSTCFDYESKVIYYTWELIENEKS